MPTIAYLGPEHTNTHLAALSRFGKRSDYVHQPTVDDIFSAVERRKTDFGVVPIENSLEGAVTHTLDRFIDFIDTPVKIHGEIEEPIQHFLIVRKGMTAQDIRIVYSHPQALAQCNAWLERHLPRVNRLETSSTAEAVERVADDRAGALGNHRPEQRAAIAREELADRYGLQATAIPQTHENKTRFLVIGLGMPPKGRRNKTSILFALKDRPGALYDALAPFKREKINLTKIESRPSKKRAWEYFFFIDIEGHESEPRIGRALDAVKRNSDVFQILGSYPAVTSSRPKSKAAKS